VFFPKSEIPVSRIHKIAGENSSFVDCNIYNIKEEILRKIFEAEI
jgi:hypothetical protein